MKILSLFSFLVLFTQVSLAAVLLEGKIELQPTVMHKPPLIANMQVIGEGDRRDGLTFQFEKAFMGKMAHNTNEAYFYNPANASSLQQLNVAYKIEGAPHEWFMIMIATSDAAGVNYAAQFYMIDDSIQNISTIIRDFVTAAPSSWKNIGTGQLVKK